MKTTFQTTLRVAALAAVLAAPPGAAQRAERAQRPPCSGVYTGSARGIFWCKVVALHDARNNRSSLRFELAGDVQLTGDALQVTPGGVEWKGPMVTGALMTADASVVSAGAYVQTGLPPNPADYVAAKAWPKFAVEQGQVKVELTHLTPGAVTDGVQAFEAHGTVSARLPPLPGGKAVGEVRLTLTF